ncbi:MAG: L,D-transpeptidase family protein [Proteobacteria bacterium]|nr:L,D-transpeptidase family protein [Pseudomonadota bacterium]
MSVGTLKPAAADDIVGALWQYRVTGGEIFAQIAEATGIGFVELRAANPGVDAWVPPAGSEILIPSQHILPAFRKSGLVINLGDFRLYLFDDMGSLLGSWPIGVGKAGRETPLGSYRVTELRKHPTWRPTKNMLSENPSLPAAVPPGPTNPLGTYAVRIGWDGYALHGTNKPAGVGRMVSSGCIRLYEEDIRQVFEQVVVGDAVHIINEPVKLGWYKDFLYLEAHPDPHQSYLVETTGSVNSAVARASIKEIKERLGAELAQKIDWAKVSQTLSERRGISIAISVR